MAIEIGQNQKYVAGGVAIGALLVALCYMTWLVFLATSGRIFVDPDVNFPKLRTGWSVFLWLAALGASAQVIYATLLTVISAGLGFLATLYTSKRALIGLAAISLLGILMASVLMYQVDTGTIGTPGHEDSIAAVLQYTRAQQFADVAALRASSHTILVAVIGWYGAFLVSQLGLGAGKADGAAHDLLSHLVGK